mmetsp:Transcript_11605/g.28598  ORF Transcript_11605/g.28598 Transcript_11605/m.28598 type:complete len:412 (-) Transcript_11605:107-1342(-)
MATHLNPLTSPAVSILPLLFRRCLIFSTLLVIPANSHVANLPSLNTHRHSPRSWEGGRSLKCTSSPHAEQRRPLFPPLRRIAPRHLFSKRAMNLKFGAAASSNEEEQGNGEALRIVITGGSKGLGRALAIKFLQSGDKVLIASRNEERVREAVDEMRKLGNGEVEGVKCDIVSAADLEKLSAEATSRWGGIDMWICNAATNGYIFEELSDSSLNTLQEIVNTNLLGTLYSTREAIKTMKRQSDRPGFIVLLEGAGGSGEPTSLYAAYGATKAGVAQFASSLRSELENTNVNVVTLNPGLVNTELLRAPGAERINAFGRALVDTFVSNPDEVAEEVVPQLRDIATSSIKAKKLLSGEQQQLIPPADLAFAAWVSYVRNKLPLTVSVLNLQNLQKKIGAAIEKASSPASSSEK